MANATAITLTAASANGAVAQPTADVLDTGTTAVTLPLALAGVGCDRVLLEVKNTAAAALKVEILAGDNPPAQRAGLGDLTLVAAAAQNAVNMFGPFEAESLPPERRDVERPPRLQVHPRLRDDRRDDPRLPPPEVGLSSTSMTLPRRFRPAGEPSTRGLT
jgi:hypothetical protein